MKYVYLSIDDGHQYSYVGMAIDPITADNPFKLECDEGLIGTSVYVKITDKARSDLTSAPARKMVVPPDGLILIASEVH